MSFLTHHRIPFKRANSIGIDRLRVLKTVPFIASSVDRSYLSGAVAFSEFNGPLASQEISRILWKLKTQHRVFQKVTLFPILTLTNTVCEIPSCLFNINYTCPIHLQLFSVTLCYWFLAFHAPKYMSTSHSSRLSGDPMQVPWLCLRFCNKFILYVT